jgi:hypothetical protein
MSNMHRAYGGRNPYARTAAKADSGGHHGYRKWSLSPFRADTTMTAAVQPAIVEAQKAVGAVLEALEAKTGGDVKDIALEDMVDTDPRTGAPVVQKAVEIKLQERPRKKWAT